MPVAQPRPPRGASSEVARDINKRIVLNLIRTRQPISRADLARLSGLQRSTISLIVEELIGDQWVQEGHTGRLPRGRRPTYLHLNRDRVIIGVDIRPTETTVAMADVNGKFSGLETMVTPSDHKLAIDHLIGRIQALMGAFPDKQIEGVGISLPGRFDHNSDRLVFAPNLQWPAFDLRQPISLATGLDVEFENAANACVLATVWFDHETPCNNLVVVTVSEGIGTGVLVNGKLARGLNGMAGEFGHVPLDPDGPPCGCGGHGCWEVFASNRAALRYYGESNPQSTPVTFPALLRLADQGDPCAVQALDTMARYLGRGMRMIVAGLAPERIVVIGDLTQSWERFGPIIQSEVEAQVLPGGYPPRLTPSHEGGLARLRGTIALVLQKHFGTGHELPA